MSGQEHTPGTWCVSNGKLLRVCAHVPNTQNRAVVICGVHRIGSLGGLAVGGDPLANARLIAAPPDLLEALEELLPQNLGLLPIGYHDSATVPVDMTFGEIRRARAALAKARGQQ